MVALSDCRAPGTQRALNGLKTVVVIWWSSPVRIVDTSSAGTCPPAGGRCEPPTTPHSVCAAPRPAGEAWAAGPGRSRPLRAASRGRPAGPRSAPSESPCTAGYSATTSRSLTPARRPGSGDARRAPVRCRHDRLPLPHCRCGRHGSSGTAVGVNGAAGRRAMQHLTNNTYELRYYT